MRMPKTQFARNGDINIAYQVIGDGPLDLVLVLGFATHLEVMWELPDYPRFIERLASFSRVIIFDKRGMGLSDRPSLLTTFEEQHDDVRAVLDAVGSKCPALLGFTEGGPMSLLFAATYPERTAALVLLSSYAKGTRSNDYPHGATPEMHEKLMQKMGAQWGREPFLVHAQAPSRANDASFVSWFWKLQRYSQTATGALAWYRRTIEIDVRHVLPVIRVPTLILHRADDRVMDVGHSRFMARHIRGAKYVELAGADNFPGSGDMDGWRNEVEEFLTGVRPVAVHDRRLATVMFTDICGATETAARLGDRRWGDLLEAHHRVVRAELVRFAGQEVDTAGDGFLATFDGPGRAIHCAAAIVQSIRPFGISVRVGLHTGECELIAGKLGGIAVHIGARVAAKARDNEVLVTRTVKDLVAGSQIEFADRGEATLKGIPGEWQLFAVEPKSLKL